MRWKDEMEYQTQMDKNEMKQIKLTERERDALSSLVRMYAENADTLKTREGRKFKAEEFEKLLDKLNETDKD